MKRGFVHVSTILLAAVARREKKLLQKVTVIH